MVWGLLPLPYMCPLIFLSRGCVLNGWRYTSTTLHVSTELITWLGWEWVELYLNSPTYFHRTFYRVAWLRIVGILPPLRHMCPQNFYHVAGLRIVGALPPLPYMYPQKFLSRGWFENRWSSISTSLQESTELFITWLYWEWVELYPHSPTCVHRTFYHVAGWRINGALPPPPHMCPKIILSRGLVKTLWSSTPTPLHVSAEIFITLLF